MKVYCQFGCNQLSYDGKTYFCGKNEEVFPVHEACKHPMAKKVDREKEQRDREAPKASLTGLFLDAIDDGGSPTPTRSPRETQELIEKGLSLGQI